MESLIHTFATFIYATGCTTEINVTWGILNLGKSISGIKCYLSTLNLYQLYELFNVICTRSLCIDDLNIKIKLNSAAVMRSFELIDFPPGLKSTTLNTLTKIKNDDKLIQEMFDDIWPWI